MTACTVQALLYCLFLQAVFLLPHVSMLGCQHLIAPFNHMRNHWVRAGHAGWPAVC